jgi:hypothetical protein
MSIPRITKDLQERTVVNHDRAGALSTATEWSPERLAKRLRTELPPCSWQRIVSVANRRGRSVEQLLERGLSEES